VRQCSFTMFAARGGVVANPLFALLSCRLCRGNVWLTRGLIGLVLHVQSPQECQTATHASCGSAATCGEGVSRWSFSAVKFDQVFRSAVQPFLAHAIDERERTQLQIPTLKLRV
jgi:hypothetical protein